MSRQDAERIGRQPRQLAQAPRVEVAVQQPPPPMGPRVDALAWRQILEWVRVGRPALAALLERAAVLRFSSETIVLGYKVGSMLAPHAAEASAVAHLVAACVVVLGRAPAITFEAVPGERPAARRRQRAERGPRR